MRTPLLYPTVQEAVVVHPAFWCNIKPLRKLAITLLLTSLAGVGVQAADLLVAASANTSYMIKEVSAVFEKRNEEEKKQNLWKKHDHAAHARDRDRDQGASPEGTG